MTFVSDSLPFNETKRFSVEVECEKKFAFQNAEYSFIYLLNVCYQLIFLSHGSLILHNGLSQRFHLSQCE